MEKWLEFLHHHAQHAHWMIFCAALVAGINIPISIDLLMILSAILAATIIPSNLIKLFFAVYLGCLLSAWVAYWIGRKLGPKLIQLTFFSKVFSQKRMQKIKRFYERHGHFALILGRFIPFGVRNGLYMSSGMSRMSFSKFILWEGLACTLWSVFCFSLYYALSKNINTLYFHVKAANLLIFIAFSVTVIGIIWYKKKKTTEGENV